MNFNEIDKLKEQLDLIDKSPYYGIDKVILKKIAGLSKNKGFCYASQQHLANELRTSKPSLQRHLYRLEKDGVLNVAVQAGQKQQNHYSIAFLQLRAISNQPNFKPSPLHKTDTVERVRQRLSSLHKNETPADDEYEIDDAIELDCGYDCDVNPENVYDCAYHDPRCYDEHGNVVEPTPEQKQTAIIAEVVPGYGFAKFFLDNMTALAELRPTLTEPAEIKCCEQNIRYFKHMASHGLSNPDGDACDECYSLFPDRPVPAERWIEARAKNVFGIPTSPTSTSAVPLGCIPTSPTST
jgi:DNA-binding Lrp family transcriptional regulator